MLLHFIDIYIYKYIQSNALVYMLCILSINCIIYIIYMNNKHA